MTIAAHHTDLESYTLHSRKRGNVLKRKIKVDDVLVLKLGKAVHVSPGSSPGDALTLARCLTPSAALRRSAKER